MLTHEEIQKRTLTENPLVLLQTRETASLDTIRDHLRGIIDGSLDEAAVNSAQLSLDELDESDLWKTERIFIDPREAERFVEAQPHRYAPNFKNERWRFFTGIAEGVLVDVVKATRAAANA